MGENPKDSRVKDAGRCGETCSSNNWSRSQNGRMGLIGGLGVLAGISSIGSASGLLLLEDGLISLLASKTILPSVQLMAMSPTESTD
jgi:hypothetical protein